MMIICDGKIKKGGHITQAYEGDAGYDIYSAEDIVVPARGKTAVSTNLYIELPFGFFGLVYSRSGLSFKHSIEVGAGVIDSNYRGEVKVLLYNHSDKSYYVKRGDKIAQLLVLPVAQVSWKFVDELSNSSRNEKGFGSSDKKD